MKAVGYVRVSTEGQAAEGISLEAQRAKIEAWAVAHDYELVNIFEDAGLSGSNAEKRPGLQAALQAACDQRSALMVYSLSRLARSTKDAIAISERLDKAGADLVSLSERIDTTSAAGRMIFRMLAVLSEFERDLVSERTAVAMAHLKAKGQRISGRIPYGYTLGEDGKTLVPETREQEALTLARKLRHEAGLKLREVQAELAAAGHFNRQGNPFDVAALHRMLKGAA